MDNSIIEELFEKRADTMMQKPNKELDSKMVELAISEKEDAIIELFRKETNDEICKQLENLFFYYCNAKESETTLYNEYYYKLGFADAIKLKQEIKEIV
jgi:ATP-dependent protease HslVU (ClpYQ) ATPase subunit